MKEEYLSKLKKYITATNAAKAILIIPSYISSETRDYFENNNEVKVEIWDIEKIYYLIHDDTEHEAFPYHVVLVLEKYILKQLPF